MIREIRTVDELAALIESGEGYLYNDFGGRDPKMCPIHAMGCRWVPTMLRTSSSRLSISKLWSDDLSELVAEVESRGKVFAYCGSEPGLASGNPTPPATRNQASTPPGRGGHAAPVTEGVHVEHDFRVLEEPGVVCVHSPYRLQFDNKPETKALKLAIGQAVEKLSAGPGQMLEAVYTSASPDLVDAENVLLYNVGTGRFAASARHGLRFERVHAARPEGAGAAHHHHYRLVGVDSPSSHWRRTRLVVSATGLLIPHLDAMSKPDAVWLATRRGVAAGAIPYVGQYALEVTLTVGMNDSARAAEVVKPLVDGLIAGLHAHNGRDADIVTPRLAARLALPTEQVEAMLRDDSRAWLGPRRLLWPRAEGIQWNPGDDTCVSAVLHLRRDPRFEWRVEFELHAVEPID